MTPVSVIALFCEDIREDKNGTISLIGIFPDNLEGQVAPGSPTEGTPVIPRLCVYARLNFDPKDKIGSVKCKMTFPTGEERDLDDMFDSASVEAAKAGALNTDAPVAGLFSRMLIPNFPILAEGRMQLVVTIKGADYVAGALNVKISRPSPTASEPPSLQSPSDAQMTKLPPGTFRLSGPLSD